jgi:hypothetical protein
LLLVYSFAGDVQSLVDKLRDLAQHKIALAEQLKALQPVPRLPLAIVEGRLAEWRRHLRASVTTGRGVLQRVVDGRIVFTPDGDGGYTHAKQRVKSGLISLSLFVCHLNKL